MTLIQVILNDDPWSLAQQPKSTTPTAMASTNKSGWIWKSKSTSAMASMHKVCNPIYKYVRTPGSRRLWGSSSGTLPSLYTSRTGCASWYVNSGDFNYYRFLPLRSVPKHSTSASEALGSQLQWDRQWRGRCHVNQGESNHHELANGVQGHVTPALLRGAIQCRGHSNPIEGNIERIPHNNIHSRTGDATYTKKKDMGAFYSADRDLLFYSYHSNVDL